jgi:hypothetical protein
MVESGASKTNNPDRGLYTSMTCSASSCVSSVPYGSCPDKFGCHPNGAFDFCIKRHDTKPAFKVAVEDCDGPMDLTGLVLEVSMWAKAKLKADITSSVLSFKLADNIGFEQIAVGDIIVMQRVRAPEQMLVVDFDETNSLVVVERGYHGTPTSSFKKGTPLRIFRVLNAPGSTEMDVEDIQQVDGTVLTDQITESRLVYEWAARDTCLPGCYYLEFKLLKMLSTTAVDSSTAVSQTGSYTDFQMGCTVGTGVDWVRRYPNNSCGYYIKIVDTPTSENVF